MNITEFAVKNQVVTWLLALLTVVAGLVSYERLGKLEDPEFTIKSAIITTQYPGAGPQQVEKEVTERIEIALQEIAEIDHLESISREGLSIIKVNIKSQYWSDKLPQIWDVMRRKIRNVEQQLPIGVARPVIRDDFGDVYGFVLAVTGDGYNYKELEVEVKKLKRQLSLVEGVSRVEFWGKRSRAIYLKVNESRIASLGISARDISEAVALQNNLAASGHVYYDQQAARIEVTGEFSSIEDIANLSLRAPKISELVTGQTQDELLTIRDVATLEESFIEPSRQVMRYNGEDAIGLAISNVPGSNILDIGARLDQRLTALQGQIPVGIETHKVAWQSDEVGLAIDSFIVSLMQAVGIVLVVLALAMGWRMGVIIGTALILTILGTLFFMALLGIDLQRISLGALVIALGMMVDNAIVVGDGVLVRLRQGQERIKAAVEAARGPSMPLLGATVIAVLAFYPIGGSTESVGEYCLSLFQVVGISLLISWVVSVTVTPLHCFVMLKTEAAEAHEDDYNHGFYKSYKGMLEGAIRHRYLMVLLVTLVLLASAWAFKFIPQQFFPESTRPQFMIDMYAPSSTRLSFTSETLRKAEQKILTEPGVESVSAFIGSGPPRFYLPVEPELVYPSYAQLVVNVSDYEVIERATKDLQPWLYENFPEISTFRVRRFSSGPGSSWKYELRLIAPEAASLDDIRHYGDQALALLDGNSMVRESRLEWRERVPKVVVDYDQSEGRWARVSRKDVEDATRRAFDGLPVGQYREGDELLPILLRNDSAQREDPATLYSVQIQQSLSSAATPLSQVVDDISLEWEDPFIYRRNRQRMITIQAHPVDGVTLPTLRNSVLAEVEAFEQTLPPGYRLEWGAETESSADSQRSLLPGLVPSLLLMFFIIVALFNSLKPALIIFMTIPLIIIGISTGLLASGLSFGFMALLGALSLMGMMIKNSIVLIDEIKLNIEQRGQSDYQALVNAGLSRIRPVALAAATTILGVVPLLQDSLWVAMAVTIMAGLLLGTLFTMVVVPVLYAILYRVKPE